MGHYQALSLDCQRWNHYAQQLVNWKEVVLDAKICRCFFGDDAYENLIEDVLKNIETGVRVDIFDADSQFFSNAKWKVPILMFGFGPFVPICFAVYEIYFMVTSGILHK